MAQRLKRLPARRETWVRSLGWEDLQKRERLPIPVFWPREFHGLYSPWGCKESDMTEQLHFHFQRHRKDVMLPFPMQWQWPRGKMVRRGTSSVALWGNHQPRHHWGQFAALSQCSWLRTVLCSPTDCSLPGSSVHGVLQARILGWVAMSSSRGSSCLSDQTQVFHITGCFFTN